MVKILMFTVRMIREPDASVVFRDHMEATLKHVKKW